MRSVLRIVIFCLGLSNETCLNCGSCCRIKARTPGKGTNKKHDSVRESVVPQYAKMYSKDFFGNRGERIHRICSSDSLSNSNASESMSEIAVHPWYANETTCSNRASKARQGASGSYNTVNLGQNSLSQMHCEIATAHEGDYDNLSRSKFCQNATDKSILSRLNEEPTQNPHQHEHKTPEEASNRYETSKKRDDMKTQCEKLPPAFRSLHDVHAKEREPLIKTARENKTLIESTRDDNSQILQALQRCIDRKLKSLDEVNNSVHSKFDSVKKSIHSKFDSATSRDLFEFHSLLCKSLETCEKMRMFFEDRFDQVIHGHNTPVSSSIPFSHSYRV